MRQSFLLAVQFLTRLPVRVQWDDRAAGRSLLFYPLIGLLMGLVLVLPALLAGAGSPGLAAALVLLVWVLASAALHLDGLADAADAWLGGQGDRERTLAIMKDPYCGPAGVVAVALVLLLKWQALAVLLDARVLLPLVIAAVLGRTAALALFYTTPYVRSQGLGSALAAHLPRPAAAKVLAGVLALVLLASGIGGVWALLLGAAVFAGCRWLMLRRLGGTTGDTAGAVIELVETAAVVGAALAFS